MAFSNFVVGSDAATLLIFAGAKPRFEPLFRCKISEGFDLDAINTLKVLDS